MQLGVIYDVVDRQHPTMEVGHFHNGRFFNAVKSPPFMMETSRTTNSGHVRVVGALFWELLKAW